MTENTAFDVVTRSLEQYAHRMSKEENEMDKLRSAGTTPAIAASGAGNADEDGAASWSRRGKTEAKGASGGTNKVLAAPAAAGP